MSEITQVAEKKQRGRKVIVIDWPKEIFSINDLVNIAKTNSIEITRVGLQLKTKQALEKGILELAGEVQPRLGRPFRTYKIKTV